MNLTLRASQVTADAGHWLLSLCLSLLLCPCRACLLSMLRRHKPRHASLPRRHRRHQPWFTATVAWPWPGRAEAERAGQGPPSRRRPRPRARPRLKPTAVLLSRRGNASCATWRAHTCAPLAPTASGGLSRKECQGWQRKLHSCITMHQLHLRAPQALCSASLPRRQRLLRYTAGPHTRATRSHCTWLTLSQGAPGTAAQVA